MPMQQYLEDLRNSFVIVKFCCVEKFNSQAFASYHRYTRCNKKCGIGQMLREMHLRSKNKNTYLEKPSNDIKIDELPAPQESIEQL